MLTVDQHCKPQVHQAGSHVHCILNLSEQRQALIQQHRRPVSIAVYQRRESHVAAGYCYAVRITVSDAEGLFKHCG